MFGIFVLTCILECLIFLPISFTAFQFYLSPNNAFLLSIGLSLVSVSACFICRLKLKGFLYKCITCSLSILFAYLIAGQVSILMGLIVAICIFIFIRIRLDMMSGTDLVMQMTGAALLFNILLAFLAFKSNNFISSRYSNIAILISTTAIIILLVIRQTDHSRKFGKNNMRIGTTQRKNNQVLAVAALVILFAVSAIGQVSNIYRFVLNIFAWLGKLFANIFKPVQFELPENKEMIENTLNSAGERTILDTIVEILSVIIIVAVIGLVLFFFIKLIINLCRKLMNWFKGGEQKVKRYYENGHVDEGQSLLNKNLSNIAKKIRNMLGVFDREVPYNKLPNRIEKTRRLFRNYRDKVQHAGMIINKSSTAEEICKEVSEKNPQTKPINSLLSECYDAARYGNIEPSLKELAELESKLLK